METRKFKADIMLLVVAAIWGLAFVAQRLGMDHLGPFGFNAARFLLGASSLLPLLWFFKAKPEHKQLRPLLVGGISAGAILFLGASLQQAGLLYTTAGNAGFITGLYIVLVPLMGLFVGQRTGANTWIGAIIAVAGLYLLSVNQDFSINQGDLLVLIGAAFWAGHVLIIGKLASEVDNLRLAIVQFFVCAILSLLVALGFEQDSLTLSNLTAAWQPIAYAGLFSVGIAYTLQVFAQRDAPASHAAIIMSLETVFAALGGWLMLQEQMSSRAFIGCGLMLLGMLASQVRLPRRRQKIAPEV